MWREIVRPRPVPDRSVPASACWKRSKNVLLEALGNARTLVFHLDPYRPGGGWQTAQKDRRAIGRVLDRIEHEVDQHLYHLVAIHPNQRGRCAWPEFEGKVAFPDQRFERLSDLME